MYAHDPAQPVSSFRLAIYPSTTTLSIPNPTIRHTKDSAMEGKSRFYMVKNYKAKNKPQQIKQDIKTNKFAQELLSCCAA